MRVSGCTDAVRSPRRLLVGAGIILLTLCPLLLGSDYLRFVAALILINAIASTGINLSMGYCGLVSVGHAGFLIIGAYVAAFFVNHISTSAVLAIIAGAVAAGAAGIVIGLPTLRLNPLYIAMVTFGFGQATNLVALNWIEVTGGPNGLAVTPPTILGFEASDTTLYLAIAALFLASLWVASCSGQSRLGRAFLAIKESEIAARSMGIAVERYKMIAFAISSIMGGIAGGLYALVSGYVNPDAFVFQVSVLLVTMCVAGGLGRLSGPIIGAAILTILPELLRPFAEYKELFSGIILLGFLVLMPRGLASLISGWVDALTIKRRPV
jgi:branched-chain amino acid transport system permease protein